MGSGSRHTWALILAAGDGTRIATFTQDASGRAVPKQYCSFGGPVSLLRLAVARAQRMVAGDRVAIVVADQHRPWWEEELAALPAADVVIQPENKGTAIGLLLGLTHVLHRDPDARFIVFPSDHFVADEDTLHGALLDAVEAMQADPRRIVLLGMALDELDPEYGWVLCGRSSATGVRDVLSFREKPDRDTAASLRKQGALVNSFMLVGTGAALMGLFDQTVGEALRAVRTPGPSEAGRAQALRDLYARLPSRDFSRDVLEPQTARLSVVAVPPCGWTDVGTPARLMMLLRRRRLEGTTRRAPGCDERERHFIRPTGSAGTAAPSHCGAGAIPERGTDRTTRAPAAPADARHRRRPRADP
jgi:mannose-1-phosphate guanylyltransferase